jgi:hypothetical protein
MNIIDAVNEYNLNKRNSQYKFIQTENIGRLRFSKVLQDNGVTNGYNAKNLYDSVDYYYTNSKNQLIGVEIKERNQKYLNCNHHLMEKLKYDRIIEKLDKGEIDNAYYACFFGRTLLMYPLSTIRRKVDKNMIMIAENKYVKTTVGNRTLVPKKMLYLNPDWAFRYELNSENHWELVRA